MLMEFEEQVYGSLVVLVVWHTKEELLRSSSLFIVSEYVTSLLLEVTLNNPSVVYSLSPFAFH